jgi:hypothetical protein
MGGYVNLHVDLSLHENIWGNIGSVLKEGIIRNIASIRRFINQMDLIMLMFYAIIIVLSISIDKRNIRTISLRNTHSQETQHLSSETL